MYSLFGTRLQFKLWHNRLDNLHSPYRFAVDFHTDRILYEGRFNDSLNTLILMKRLD